MSDKRTAKRVQIIEASIDLFASKGFWNTPTSKITKHAKVSTGTLFNYFESKDVLIDEVYLQLKQEQTAHITSGYPEDGTVRARAEHIWFRYIDWSVQHPIRYRLVQQMRLSTDLVSQEAQQRALGDWTFAYTLTQEAIASGAFRAISAEYIGHLIVSQLNAAASYAIAHNLTDMPLTKHITRSFEIYWAGVTS
ncbi:MAG: TetR/AcrR family transcriptional regulator [Candidatus Promineifilaceae bacterium]